MIKFKKYSKMLILFLLLFTIVIGNIQSSFATTKVDVEKINSAYDITIDVSSKINLYGDNDEVIAYFYKLEDGGYIIIDLKTNDFIEYSTESDNLFITDTSAKYYYGGALNYFEEVSANSIREVATKEVFSKKIATIQRNSEKVYMDILQTKTLPVGNFSNKLAYTPRTYDTNDRDNCGSTAAAILLAYYYDHINNIYVDKSLITSNGVSLTNKMISYIEPNGGGSTYTTVVNGLNKYLGSRGLSKTSKRLNLREGAEKIYNERRPVIGGVTKHPTYKEHWVVAYGFTISNLLVKSYTVNNGWGQNGIVINSQYLDGAVCI